ncbi:MAG TPA: glycosyltransferase family 39 protein [Crocinitomicaceae bacterium]|nr:glycosyltransferase family 39 protein [Crocinitomicaceae bacterium]
MKAIFSIKLKNNSTIVGWAIGCFMLLVFMGFLPRVLNVDWVLNASTSNLKVYYPRFFFVIKLVAVFFLFFKNVIVAFQVYILGKLLNQKKHARIILALIILCFSLFLLPNLILNSLFILFIYGVLYYKKQIKHFKISFNKTLFILFIIAFLIRLVSLFLTDNACNGDAPARLITAKGWMNFIEQTPFSKLIVSESFYMPSIDWLPLHFYFVGIVGKLSGDWEYVPRILSAVIGSLAIYPLYKLTLLKFKNKTIALISVVILIFYGQHILFSTLVMSEVFYVLFILYAYYFIEKWTTEDSHRYLFPIILCIGCLNLLRYEGWVITCMLVALLPFLKSMKKINYFNLFCLLLSSILIIFFLEMTYGQHPLRGILYSDYEVKIHFKNTSPQSAIKFFLLSSAYIPFVSISIISTVISILGTNKTTRYKQLILFSLYVLPLFPFLYKIINGTLTLQPRYLMIYMIPLIPFVANFLYIKILSKRGVFLRTGIILLFIISMNGLFIISLKKTENYLKYPKAFHESSKYVSTMKNGYFYVDNEMEYGTQNWLVLSKLYEKNLLYNKLTNETIQQLKLISQKYSYVVSSVDFDEDVAENWNEQTFDSIVNNKIITHIMLFPNGKLNKKLHFTKQKEQYNGQEFIKIFDRDGYRIYQLFSDNP